MEDEPLTRVLILGANGMLGGSILRYFTEQKNFQTYGIVRSKEAQQLLLSQCDAKVIRVEADNGFVNIQQAIYDIKPHVVFNCIGVIKQKKAAEQYPETIAINSLLPHKIANYCSEVNAKLIHFSTDCVFDGSEGNYTEKNLPNAIDLYGKSKHLGEISYGGHLTLRTSIIGHELGTNYSLIDWFLSQHNEVQGYSSAIFSGLPTVTVARFCHKYAMSSELKGLYHLSSKPIDKYALLQLVSHQYLHRIKIKNNASVVVNRSLNSEKLYIKTGFIAAPWPNLIKEMFHEYKKYHF